MRGVGEVSARDLASDFGNLDALSKASADDLQQIEGIGPNIAEAIVDWFVRPANQKILKKLKAVGLWPIERGGKAMRRRAVERIDIRRHRHASDAFA